MCLELLLLFACSARVFFITYVITLLLVLLLCYVCYKLRFSCISLFFLLPRTRFTGDCDNNFHQMQTQTHTNYNTHIHTEARPLVITTLENTAAAAVAAVVAAER